MVTRSSQLVTIPSGPIVRETNFWMNQNSFARTASSNSFEMLARFQQKQLQEKEQKLLQLYDQQQQRAHQVAQRGSAGSNDSHTSTHGNGIANPTAKVRQMFDERRQQGSVKGIDKSYPLEPLENKGIRKLTGASGNKGHSIKAAYNNAAENRPNGEMKRSTRADVNSNISVSKTQSSSSSSFSKESHSRSSSRQLDNSSSQSRVTSSRRNDENEQRMSNGYSRNGHYEINIDEVIDNEAMQRNRMLAKFHPSDIEKRRRFSGDIDAEDVQQDLADGAAARNSEPKGERLKNANVARRSNTVAKKRPESLLPMGGNVRESSVMKPTESASLKVKSPPANKNRLVMRRKSSLKRKPQQKKKKRRIQKKQDSCDSCMTDMSMDWHALKSTPLICEILRKHSKLHKTKECQKLGKVKAIVMKIENKMITIGTDLPKLIQSLGPVEDQNFEDVVAAAITTEAPNSDSIAEVEKRGVAREDESAAEATDSPGESEKLLEEQSKDQKEMKNFESKVTEEKEKIKASGSRRRLSSDVSVGRVRRASFELKRLMFEQLQGSRDRLEKQMGAGDDDAEASAGRRKSADGKFHKGFERHTSAWMIRISQSNSSAAKEPKSKPAKATAASEPKKPLLAAAAAAAAAEEEKCISKKLLEARDSIELTRVPIKTNLPACKKKIISNAQSFLEKTLRRASGNDETPGVVETQSPHDTVAGVDEARERNSVTSAELNPVNDNVSSSTLRSPASCPEPPAPARKAADARAPEPVIKKNVAPYPSSRSPDNTAEQKARPLVAKSTSLKFLSRMVGSNGDVPSAGEPSEPAAHRRPSITKADSLDSPTANSRSKPFDEEQRTAGTTPAPRTAAAASSLSSSSSLGTNNRSHGSIGSMPSRTAAKTKAPTPATRTSALSSAGDDGLATCKICSRRFASDRIGKHEQICAKTAQKKRKQFDVVTHRVKGTELEAFVQKPSKKQSKAHHKPEPAAAAASSSSKSNWRRKHEDFINAIRSAKQVQAHLAAGGKLSDLPPPPPSDTSDYVQCPHCSRKFSQGAAERHIPKCETMLHNKPRAQPRQTRR